MKAEIDIRIDSLLESLSTNGISVRFARKELNEIIQQELKEMTETAKHWIDESFELESQLKERDEVLDDVLNYIQNSDDSYFSSLATRIRTFKTK